MKAILLLLLITNLGCKSRRYLNKVSKEDKELCISQANNVWINNKCVTKSSFIAQELECEKDGKHIFKNETCYSTEELMNRQEKCINQGGQWEEDQSNNTFACIGGVQTFDTEAECNERKDNSTWDEIEKICITPEGKLCRDGGDIWTSQLKCISPKENQCRKKTDGSKWKEDKKYCASPEEIKCDNKGIDYTFDVNAETEKCRIKNFLEFCDESKNGLVDHSTDLKQSVDSILKALDLDKNDCKEGYSKLKDSSSLRLKNIDLKNLKPIMFLHTTLKSLNISKNENLSFEDLWIFENLTSLIASHTNLQNLEYIKPLKKLSSLNISNNPISDLKDISSFENLMSLWAIEISDFSDLSFIKNTDTLVNLSSIDLSNNCKLEDISNLSFLTNLMSLTIINTNVKEESIPIPFQKADPNCEYTGGCISQSNPELTIYYSQCLQEDNEP